MIPTKERVKLQLVCREFRDDIRVRIGIGTLLDENTTWGEFNMKLNDIALFKIFALFFQGCPL
jgi:hypothetical protein